jgi:hypothetical protein
MSKTAPLSALAPWAGLLVGPAAWYGFQQGLGSLVYFRCGASQPPVNLLTGLLAIAVTAAAGWWSWGVWKRRTGPPAIDVARFAALLSVLSATIFCIGIGFQTLAGLLIPPCAR